MSWVVRSGNIRDPTLKDTLHFHLSGDRDELLKKDNQVFAFQAVSWLQKVASEDAVFVWWGELRALVHRQSEGDSRPKQDQLSL